MKIKYFIFFVCIVVICPTSFAQYNNEKEIEEIYLQNPELMIIRERVLSTDYQTKLQALEGIQNMIKNGTVMYQRDSPEILSCMITRK
jgi:hypothetical protein